MKDKTSWGRVVPSSEQVQFVGPKPGTGPGSMGAPPKKYLYLKLQDERQNKLGQSFAKLRTSSICWSKTWDGTEIYG
jgi:hypothetical protein